LDLGLSPTAAAQYGFDPGEPLGLGDAFEPRIHFWNPSAKLA
jgi:hypothetical protein